MNPQQKRQAARNAIKALVRIYFKNDYNEPFELTDGQADIFLIILTKAHPRNQIIASTQYGKSDVVSMALVMRSSIYKENFAIVSGSKDKSMIIMSRVIQHTFDHPQFYKRLELDASMPLDRLRRERSKDNVTWQGGGGIRVFTANTTNRQRVKEALTGFGSPNIVEEEASLIPDDVHAMIMRMLGGHRDNFLLKLGNPFYRNHFYRSWTNDKYNKILIDYKQALTENRYSNDFIEEMQGEPFFDILYQCKFPSNDEILTGGYRKLIPDDLLESAFITEEEAQKLIEEEPEQNPKMGCDFAGAGSDRTAFVIRYPKVMKVIEINKSGDTMSQIPRIEDYIDKYNIDDTDVSLDYGGLGQGVGDRLREKDRYVNLVMFGQRAPEPDKYKNMRAYMYYQLYKWLKNGGKIVKHDGFYELLVLNYKEDSERKFQIQSKEDLKKTMQQLNISGTSPDIADAAALTFADNTALVTEDDVDII